MLGDSTFVGFKNFVRVFSDPNFVTATTNTILQIVVLVPILMVLSLLMAHYLHRRPRGHNLLATIFFVPAILSVAARSMAFVAILAPAPFGLLNNILSNLGLQHLERAWLADDQTALWCVVLVELWGGIGFTAILLEARMASVPYEVEEAATLDGVSQRGMLWRILYPMIRDYFGVMVTLQFIWTLFTSAGDVLLLTGGGPGYASTNLAYLIYSKAFMQQDLGYATAVAVLLFFVGLIGSLSIRAAFRPTY
jgi:multiple sugar transport system permease protein